MYSNIKIRLSFLALLFSIGNVVLAQGVGGPGAPPAGGAPGGGGVAGPGAPPQTPIDLYSIELALLAIGFILVTSYYLRKKQLKSL
ncbi:hypothetical protein PGK76_004500 [Riemerella anatipestifer]|uniref:Signal peptidase n=1 Tax=Riemerella anatipestifer TaxID=34085 RepID=A0AAP6HHM5_RIEAN|nr:hypothetical protein [Riemerella anatipestifer]MDW3556098.1 hypothetical protein [Riemerella anatipestifer]MDY3513475.1 hypothetical protein [Riemerella anatipestifer]